MEKYLHYCLPVSEEGREGGKGDASAPRDLLWRRSILQESDERRGTEIAPHPILAPYPNVAPQQKIVSVPPAYNVPGFIG